MESKSRDGVSTVSTQLSRSVPNQLDHVPAGPERSNSFMKKHFGSNLKLALKAPWKSLKNISRLERLGRRKNQYDFTETPPNRPESFSWGNLTGGSSNSNNSIPFIRTGLGRLAHWRNHYDLSDALEVFQSVDPNSDSDSGCRFLEFRSVSPRVLDSSFEYLDSEEPGEETDGTGSDAADPVVSPTPSETEL